MVSYGQAVSSWNQYADANNLTSEQKQAGLDKLAKGELPEGANISKVIVDGYKDGVLIAGAWAGGLFGEYAPGIVNSVTGKEIPGFVYDYWGGVASEFSSGFIKELNKPKGSSEDKKK